MDAVSESVPAVHVAVVKEDLKAGDNIHIDTAGVMSFERLCHVLWGSHGCDRPLGHEGFHQCGGDDETAARWSMDDAPCSRFYGDVGEDGQISSALYGDDDLFIEWSDPWPGKAFL